MCKKYRVKVDLIVVAENSLKEKTPMKLSHEFTAHSSSKEGAISQAEQRYQNQLISKIEILNY